MQRFSPRIRFHQCRCSCSDAVSSPASFDGLRLSRNLSVSSKSSFTSLKLLITVPRYHSITYSPALPFNYLQNLTKSPPSILMLEIRVFFLFFLVALARGYQLCWSSKEASLAPAVFSVIFLVSSPLIFHSFYAFLSPDWFPLSSFSSSSCFLKVGAKLIDLRTSFLMQAFPRSTAPDARHKF